MMGRSYGDPFRWGPMFRICSVGVSFGCQETIPCDHGDHLTSSQGSFFSTNKSRLGIFYYWIFVELSWIKCSSRRARHLIQLRILLPPRKGSGVFHCPPKQLVLEICTGCMFLGSCSRNSNQKVEPRNPPSFCSGNQVEMPACWV